MSEVVGSSHVTYIRTFGPSFFFRFNVRQNRRKSLELAGAGGRGRKKRLGGGVGNYFPVKEGRKGKESKGRRRGGGSDWTNMGATVYK